MAVSLSGLASGYPEPAGAGDWDPRMRWGEVRGEDLCDPLERGPRREVRPQQVVGYRTRQETGGLDLEERRMRRPSAVYLPAQLARVACGFPGKACCSCGLE